MPNAKVLESKKAIVEELTSKMQNATSVVFVNYNGITELEGRICQTLPAHLTLPEQGAFHLGYYHQVQKLYEKKVKEEAEHV